MYYTLKQAAEFLGLSAGNVKKLISDQQIPAITTKSKSSSNRVSYRIDDGALRQFKRAKSTAQFTAPQVATVAVNGHAIAKSNVAPGMFNIADARREINCGSETFVLNHIERGTVPTERINGRRYLSKESIEILKQKYAEWQVGRGRYRHAVATGVIANTVPQPVAPQAVTPAANAVLGAVGAHGLIAQSNARARQVEELTQRVAAVEQRLNELIEQLGG